jgi:1-acyl-sn-glycerol-3-phosphate acyltransferase
MAGNGRASLVFYAVARFVVVGATRLWTRTTVVGASHVPATGAFVLAPIHRSNIDTPLAATVTRRRLRFMGKDSLWKRSWVGWVLSAVGGFPVTRGSADREALARCIAVLAAGEPLVLFPEGTRQSGPVVHPLFDGAAYVAVKAGVPIVPVGIGGSERVMSKGSRMIRPRKCVVVVGEPIAVPTGNDGRAPRSAVKDVTAALSERLQRLFDEARERAGEN